MSVVVLEETVRRHLTSAGYWTLVALVAVFAAGTAHFNSPASTWPALVALLAIVTGAGLIGPEFSTGTLQLILVKPVTRSAYLLSRVAGAVLVVWIAAAIGAGAELITRAAIGENVHAATLGAALVNAMIHSVIVVSLLTFLGSFTRAYFNVAIYLVLQVGIGVAIGLLRRFPQVVRVLEKVSNNLFPDPPPVISGHWMLLVLSNAAVALVLACLIFRRREVPYGAD